MVENVWPGAKWADMVIKQGVVPTMDKPLIITVCPVGALVSRRQNPNLPYTPEEIAADAIAAYREGAAVAHLHNRDANGKPITTTEYLKRTIDLIRAECPDMIIQPSSCHGYLPGSKQYTLETVKPMVDALHALDMRYMESTIYTPVSYYLENLDGSVDITLASESNTVATVRYLQDNRIKPEFMCHNWEGIMNVREWLIKPGILQKPYLLSMGPGMHNAAEAHLDPWGLLYVLGMMKMMPEDTIVGLSAGGRNWLPLSVFAILLGVDGVRVGMEDHLWMYPHRNELIERSADEARKIATIARELGRAIATPGQARAIMGMMA